MKKLKQWLTQRFLPAWANEWLLEENARLVAALAQERAKVERRDAYIRGMEKALRCKSHTTIYVNGGADHGSPAESIV